MIRRFIPVLVLIPAMLCRPAFADVTTIGWWRLGEADPGAVADAQGQNPTNATTGSFPLSWDSGTNGNAFYRSDTPPGARLRLGASTLAMEINNTVGYPGYHTATVPSDAATNIGLEIWAKANSALVEGPTPATSSSGTDRRTAGATASSNRTTSGPRPFAFRSRKSLQ